TRPLKEITSTGGPLSKITTKGGAPIGENGAAARAPSNNAAPWRRQPARPAVHIAARCNGASGPAARNATPAGVSDIGVGRRRRQAAHAHALDAPGIRVEHFELEAGGMLEDLAAARHPAGERADQAAQGLDAILLLARQQRRRDAILQRRDPSPRIGDERAVRTLDHLRLVGVIVLVLDLADDLLDHVLDGDEAIDAAELV